MKAEPSLVQLKRPNCKVCGCPLILRQCQVHHEEHSVVTQPENGALPFRPDELIISQRKISINKKMFN